MIPYLQLPTIEIFGQVVSSFEIFVTIGLYMGFRVFLSQARKSGLEGKVAYDFFMVCVVSGFLGAHLFHVLLYKKDPGLIFDFQGLSSMGGLVGGTIGGFVFLTLKKQSVWDFVNPALWSVLIGMFWGRVGCFSVHDHPGKLSQFFLAVQFPGGARHDLGLYEMLFLLCLIVLIRVTKVNLYQAPLILISYGFFRFFFDFLRAEDLASADARYLYITPAQYIAIGFVVIGFVMANKMKKLDASIQS